MPTDTEDVIVLLDEDASIQRLLSDYCHRDENAEGDGAALRVHASMSRLRDVGDRANHDVGRR